MIPFPIIDLCATGNRIKELRKQNNISVKEISEYTGFGNPQTVYKWQRGDSLPSVDNLYALSRLFGTPWKKYYAREKKHH